MNNPMLWNEKDINVELHKTPGWRAYADKGWSVQKVGGAYPLSPPRFVAINHTTKMATDAARQISTLLRRIERGSFNYWLYTKWARREKKG